MKLPIPSLLLLAASVSPSPATAIGAPLPAILLPTAPTADTEKGPIGDTQCNMEELEQANDSQLYTILQELVQRTDFFKHFAVDLEQTCPLGKEEEEFECPGLPPISVEEDPFLGFTTEGDYGGGGCTVETFPASQALHDLSQQGFESQDQAGAFQWKKQTDLVESPSNDPLSLPESFWMDMCSHVTTGETTKTVDLTLNPKRNTGYNGTHLWNAIYQENCIAVLPGEEECFEERVLYRLLSGFHASTTIAIAKNYYQPAPRKGRTQWEANPTYFMERFQHHPEYIRNLHFSYVVLLRALQKATPLLYNYNIDDPAGSILLKRLLDSSILQSCSNVFGAFDETLMFRQDEDHNPEHTVALQQSFKGVFHNISSILDCVQCQQCKLHGKMAMLGYGTALKILFIPTSALQLERNEIVAFLNTLAKLSQSIRNVKELTQLYYLQEQAKQMDAMWNATTTMTTTPTLQATESNSTQEDSTVVQNTIMAEWDSWDTIDGAIGAIVALQRQGLITTEQEAQLVAMAMDNRDPALLILTKHYFASPHSNPEDLTKLRDLLQIRGQVSAV